MNLALSLFVLGLVLAQVVPEDEVEISTPLVSPHAGCRCVYECEELPDKSGPDLELCHKACNDLCDDKMDRVPS